MNKLIFPLLCTLPAIVAPAHAQMTDVSITAADFVRAQIAIIKGMTEMLSINGIEGAPQEVAAGVTQLTAMVQQLAAMKPNASADDVATIETELADEARTAAQALQQALETTVSRNFYNSQELADAVQAFATAFQSLK